MRNLVDNIKKIEKNKKTKKISCNALNNLIDKIYVIAFKEDFKKRDIISKYLKKYNIDFVFFDAIDGKKDVNLLKKYQEYSSWSFDNEKTHKVEQSYKRKLVHSVGAFGLLASYEKIFEEAISKNYNNIIIFEDDFLLDNNFNLIFENFLKHIKDFDIIYLGCSQHVWPNADLIKITNTENFYYTAPLITDGSFATIYNKNIFEKILDLIKRYNAPVDLYLRHITKHKKSYIIYPNIAIADTTSKSRISGYSRNLRNHSSKVRWNLKNIDFSGCQLKTSVLMANFNNEKTLEYSLNSIIKQTYSNTEIILIDDNSTDNSVSVAKNWISENKDVDIKLIELKNNVGAYRCRNVALNESSGFFITLLDPDDIFLSKKLEHDIYNYFNMPNNEVFFSRMYRSQNIDDKYFEQEKVLEQKISEERNQNKIIYNNQIKYPWNYQFRLGMPTIFVEKSFFDKYGQWKDNYRYGMDIELIQRYIVKKYNEFLDNDTLFKMIHFFQSSKYEIFCSENMNYVSFAMNKNNATNFCSKEDRNNIHLNANLELQRLLK
jgi:glycosyltransferase involved in cell wall biosynthesis/GR25 family glycosyltransferase involved in LPS biosynthesis